MGAMDGNIGDKKVAAKRKPPVRTKGKAQGGNGPKPATSPAGSRETRKPVAKASRSAGAKRTAAAKTTTKPSDAKTAVPHKPRVSSARRKSGVSPKTSPTPKLPGPLSVRLGPWGTAGIVAAIVALALFLMPHRPRVTDERGDRVPKGTWRYGIDISHNNEGRIVWDSLYVMTDNKGHTVRDPFLASEIKPVSFVYVKATEGAEFKDRNFQENWKAAGKANLRRGAYHFFRTSKTGEIQARNFIESVGELRDSDLPPVLDIETIHKGCTRKLLNERALAWLEAVESEYGKKPIVYASTSFIREHLSKEIRENYPIWVAHYGKERPGWNDWKIWQVTDRAVVKGVPGLVDLDVMEIK